MLVTFGRKKGELVEKLLIDDPGYVRWMLDQQSPSRPMAAVVRHISKCLGNFNARKFVRTCAAKKCGKTATRASLYAGVPSPMFWCETCDPYQAGASGGLVIVKTYEAAVAHVSSHGGTKDWRSDVVDALLTAKGLPKPRRAARLIAFFASST